VFKSLPLGFPHPTVKHVGESLGRPYLVGIVGRRLLLQQLQLMARGHRRRSPVEVFGHATRCRRRRPVRVIVLRPGSRQGRSTAATTARIPPGPVLVQVIMRRVHFVAALFDATTATADGRPAVAFVVVVVDGLPVAGQRLVRLAFGPRLVLLHVAAAVRRRRSGLHRARRRLDHRYLAWLMLHAVSAATGLMRRLGAAAATVLVLTVVEVMMMQVVVARMWGGYRRRRRCRQRDLR